MNSFTGLQLAVIRPAAVVGEVKRLAGYPNDGFRKSDVQAKNVQFQIGELRKDIKFVEALRMAEVEVKTAEQRLEVAGERQYQRTINGENLGGTQSDHCSSQAFGQTVHLHTPVEGPTWHAARQH